MIDIIDAEIVEIQIDHNGKIWVNVDGNCVLRIKRAKSILTEDGRHHTPDDKGNKP